MKIWLLWYVPLELQIMSAFLSNSVVVLAIVSDTSYDLDDIICFLGTDLITRFKRYKFKN